MGSQFYICFKDGFVWGLTKYEVTAKDWLEKGLIECYALFTVAGPLRG